MNLNVIADLAIFAAWGMAAAISPGPGGASSTLPYLTKVAQRGLVYSTKSKHLNLKAWGYQNELIL